MPKGLHRADRVRRPAWRRIARLTLVSGLAASTIFAGEATAFADGVGLTLPPDTVIAYVPNIGQVGLPSVGGGCTETPDTGWICTPDVTDPVGYIDENIIGPGALPGATDPDAFTVNASLAATKYQYLLETEPTVLTNLAKEVNDPVPTESQIPNSPGSNQPPGGSGPGDSAAVKISGYNQGDKPWCVGASTATVLSAWGVSSNVANVEAAEGWKTGMPGTTFGNARPYLNNHEGSSYYLYDQAGSASDLFSHVSDDIWGHYAPPMIAVSTRGLSWWNGSQTQGLHALSIYSYYSASSGGFHVWDSAAEETEGISLADTWAAMGMNGAGDQEIW